MSGWSGKPLFRCLLVLRWHINPQTIGQPVHEIAETDEEHYRQDFLIIETRSPQPLNVVPGN